MPIDEWIRDLFRTIDNRDIRGFLEFLSPEVVFRFGNAEPVRGKRAVAETARGLFQALAAIHHEVLESWQAPGARICHGRVTYTRKDASTLSVPFANIFKMDAGRVREYLVYADVSALHRPANARPGDQV
jgi:ketosteroid isomerase-like protein